MEVVKRIFAEVDAVEEDLALGGIVESRDELDDGGFALAVFADQRHALAGLDGEVEVLKHPPIGAGVGERDVAEFEAAADGFGRRQGVRFRLHDGLQLEETDEVGEEEGLVGDARRGGEGLLQVSTGLLDGRCDEEEGADVVLAVEGFPDREDVSAVVAAGTEQGEQTAPHQFAAGKVDVFFIDLLGKRGEAVGEIVAEVEELQLFGGFLAAADLAEVVHDTLDGGLAEIFGVAEEGEVGFAEERG